MSNSYWDERYSGEELAYGQAPNDYLVSMADRLPSVGDALDVGAGEGRNALFLASRGLNVLAVDQSEVGMQKAQRLAHERGIALRTQAVDLQHFDVAPNSLDVVSSIFVHLPQTLRAALHKRVSAWLKPGGVFLLEAYAPDQIERGTGGPKDPLLLAPLEVIVGELAGLAIEHRAALVRNVSEGRHHTGEASVVQVLAQDVIVVSRQSISSAIAMSQILRFSGAVRRDPAIGVWMREHPGPLGDIARHWFDVIRDCGSDVSELLHDGHPTACIEDAAFAYVNAFKAHVNVGFFRGAELADLAGLLEGAGKNMRHVKLRPNAQIDAKALTQLIKSSYLDMKRRLAAE